MLKQVDFTKLPITEVVNEIIYIAAQAGASDIHFDPSGKSIKVRFRIDGILIDYMVIPESIKKNLREINDTVTNKCNKWINHKRNIIKYEINHIKI